MGRIFTLDDLQKQFELARTRLSFLRSEIFSACPLPRGFSKEAYGFSYLRAERLSIKFITKHLEGLSWLPVQLNPDAEISMHCRSSIKRWISSDRSGQPNSLSFGNDFVHAMARVGMVYGWESYDLRRLGICIGELYRDLSCLIGLIYYGVWMAENGITGISLSYPYDLEHMAKEFATISISPEVTQQLEQRNKTLHSKKRSKKNAPALRLVYDETLHHSPPPSSC